MYSAIISIALFGMLMQTLFIVVEHREKYLLADVLKGFASLAFVTIGFVGYNEYSNDSLGCKILIGLILGMLGDIVLNLRFVLKENGEKAFFSGIVLFWLGHVLYLAALIPLTDCLLVDVCVGLSLTAALLAYFYQTMKPKVVFKVLGAVYLGAVVGMTVIAVQLALTTVATSYIVYAVGAFLFMVSDIVLIYNTFGDTSKFSLRILNLSCYYVGQLLIAGSLFLR